MLPLSVTLNPIEMTGVTNSPTNNSKFLDSEFRYALFPPVYGLFFIVGLFANVYVLFVIRCHREAKAMGEIRIYMTNLTIADLLFVCALPFWIDYYARHGDWIYSDFMCRLTGSLFFINTYCSIFFLGAISVNRYWAVTRPFDAASSDCRWRSIVICIGIWLATGSMSIPHLVSPGTNLVMGTDKNYTRCFEGYQNQNDEEKKKVAATHFAIIGMFFVIFFLVVICNLLIVHNLSSQTPPRSEMKRRATQMLLAVVGVFALCFLPHHVIQGLWALAVLQIEEGWGHVNWSLKTVQSLNDAHQVTLVLMGLNCILDPVVYFFATRMFRKFIMSHIKRITRGHWSSQTVTSPISMDCKQLQENEQCQ